jgi:hypothetical protein
MSDSIDFLKEAQSLADELSAISNPTVDELTEYIFEISNLLNTEGITQEDILNIITIFSSLLPESSSAIGDFYSLDLKQVNMSPSINTKFLTAVTGIFDDTTIDTTIDITTELQILTDSDNYTLAEYARSVGVFSEIEQIASLTTSVSFDKYDELWVLIEESLKKIDTSTIKTQYYALLTIYTNLNYSNYMSMTIDANTVTAFYDNLMIYLKNLLTSDEITTLADSILDALSTNASDSSSGMSKVEFISACEDILTLLSSYLTLDQVYYFQNSFEKFIIINFLNSSSYTTSMVLSGASTLTSTITSNFGVTSIPLTPENSARWIEELSNFFLIYPFTNDEISTIELAMTSYFEGIDYTNGLTPAQVGEVWSIFKNLADSIIVVDKLGYTAQEWLTYLKTAFTNNVTSLYGQSVSSVLTALAYFDSWAIEDIYYENPLDPTEGIMPIAGEFLSDWLDTFTQNLTGKIGNTSANILKIAVTDLIQAPNNGAYRANILRGYAVTGQNFIQIGIEILLFLSNFMEQSDLDDIGSEFTNVLVTILYVSSYIDEFWEIMDYAVMIVVAIALILIEVLISVLTAGTASTVLAAADAAIISGLEAATEAATATIDAATAAAAEVVAVAESAAAAFETAGFEAVGGALEAEFAASDLQVLVQAAFEAAQAAEDALPTIDATTTLAQDLVALADYSKSAAEALTAAQAFSDAVSTSQITQLSELASQVVASAQAAVENANLLLEVGNATSQATEAVTSSTEAATALENATAQLQRATNITTTQIVDEASIGPTQASADVARATITVESTATAQRTAISALSKVTENLVKTLPFKLELTKEMLKQIAIFTSLNLTAGAIEIGAGDPEEYTLNSSMLATTLIIEFISTLFKIPALGIAFGVVADTVFFGLDLYQFENSFSLLEIPTITDFASSSTLTFLDGAGLSEEAYGLDINLDSSS